jgi:hypothetical protein
MEDIYDIRENDKAEVITIEIEKYWNKYKNNKFALILTILRYCWLRLLVAQILKLISDICTLCQVNLI